MIRTIITPTDTQIQLSIPVAYIGKEIEITCLSLEELEPTETQKTMGDFFGVLSDESYRVLKSQTEQARKEWDRGF